MSWVDAERKLGVYTNADTPEDATVARKNGAQGIGLVRGACPFKVVSCLCVLGLG